MSVTDSDKYQIYNAEIRQIKNQQWQMAFYVLTLQGALVGFRVLVKDNITNVNTINNLVKCSNVFAYSIAIIGAILIFLYYFKLREYRGLNLDLTKNTKEEEKKKRFRDVISTIFEIVIYLIFAGSFIASTYLASNFIMNI